MNRTHHRTIGGALLVAGLAVALYGAAGLAAWVRRAVVFLAEAADDAGWLDGLGGLGGAL